MLLLRQQLVLVLVVVVVVVRGVLVVVLLVVAAATLVVVAAINVTNPDRAKHVTFKRSNSKFRKEKTNMMGTDTFSSPLRLLVLLLLCTMVVTENCMVATVTAINVMTLSVGGRNS